VGVLLLTGPSGAGKNAVAAALAPRLERCAVIDVDLVRSMVRRPHRAPWEGEEARAQHLLGARNAGALARNVLDAGYDVVLLDALTDDVAALYRAELSGRDLWIVLLLPSFEEVLRRNRVRGPRLKQEEIVMLYEQHARLTGHDERIDSTSLSADEVAALLRDRLAGGAVVRPERPAG
jgi:chloramphenicol 3-O-phosphotransferase